MMAPASQLAAALADRYRIERELGAGGMATVYLADDLKHRRKVAIKVLRPQIAAALGAERFLREIETAARLHHPHILPLYDSGEAGGFLYYTMPHVEGQSVRDRLDREKQLPLDDALGIAREVADALSYAHSKGVIHRDIKPENILLEAGHAVVADFGIARAISGANSDRLTDSGLAIGTPAYMSPEQGAGEKDLDGRADLYALGCVLYEMLAGQPPFTGPTAQSIVRQHLLVESPRITNIRPSVPVEVANALRRALAKTPADRFPDAGAFAEALIGSGTPRGVSRSPPGPGSRRRLAVPVMMFVSAIAIVAILLVRRDGGAVASAASTMAVIPFMPAVPDTALSRLGRELVITLSATLDGVGGIRAADAMTVLAQAEGRDERLTLEGAAALGRRLNSRSIVFGSLIRAGDNVKLDLGLFDSEDLRPLARASVTAPAADITALTDSTTLALLRQVWRSGETPSPSLAAVTTQSLAALRAFLEGEQHLAGNRFTEAAAAFERAFEADSTFWFAYWRYAYVRGWHGQPVDSAIRAAYWDHRTQFPERDRLLIEARDSAGWSPLRPESGLSGHVARLRAITERFPDYWPAWLQYQDQLVHNAPLLGTTYADSRAALERLVSLNPDLVPAWVHFFWVAVYQRDSAATTRILGELHRLNYDSTSMGAGDLGDYSLFQHLDHLVRSGGTLDTSLAERDAPLLVAYRGPIPAGRLAGGGYTLYEFHSAQIDMVRRMLGQAPALDIAALQWFAQAQAWAARGAWDSATVAANRYYAADPGSVSAMAGYGLAAVGGWLGAVDSTEVRRWGERVQASAVELDPEDQAEVAWLDGIAALARRDRSALQRARRTLGTLETWSVSYLSRSLAAFEVELTGGRRVAADSLARLEIELAESFSFRRLSLSHPYVASVDRLAAGRWFVEAGEYARAAELLGWYEAVFPAQNGRTAFINRILAGVAYFERARLNEAWGRRPAAQDFYRIFLERYDTPVEGYRWMAEAARAALGASKDR